MSDYHEDETTSLVASLAAVQTLSDEHPDCWVHRSLATVLSCTNLIGATFSNGSVFAEEMCCLPCRLRRALERGHADV